MNRIIVSLIVVACLLATANLSSAAEGDKKPKKPADPAAAFKKLDKNSDGAVDKDEFLARAKSDEAKEKMGKVFGRVDADGNGSISLEEWTKAHSKRAKGGDKPKKDKKNKDNN